MSLLCLFVIKNKNRQTSVKGHIAKIVDIIGIFKYEVWLLSKIVIVNGNDNNNPKSWIIYYNKKGFICKNPRR